MVEPSPTLPDSKVDLLLISGIPGSGKSSCIKKLIPLYKPNYNLFVRINFDKIERALNLNKDKNTVFENIEDLLSQIAPMDFS